jgi:hypothetical protein
MSTATRRIDAEMFSELLYDMTGLYMSQEETPLLTPILLLARALTGFVMDASIHVSNATQSVEAEMFSEKLYNMTGLYVSHEETSLLTPVVLLARALTGLVIEAMEVGTRRRSEEDGPTNRTLTGETCQTVCDLGDPIVLAVAATSCGASLLVNSFTDDTFLEVAEFTNPALICPVSSQQMPTHDDTDSPPDSGDGVGRLPGPGGPAALPVWLHSGCGPSAAPGGHGPGPCHLCGAR